MDNKALVKQLLEVVWEHGDLKHIDEHCAQDIVLDNDPGGVLHGVDAVKQFVEMNRAAFPDLKLKIEQIGAEGDLVFVYSTLRGTHHGHFQGVAPTRREAQVKGMSLWRISNGKVQQGWGLIDTAGVMAQVGASPAAQA
jgi:steroid delta-isomerase-like uncharacterized protein